MKKFDITVIGQKPVAIAGKLCAWGQIIIGNFTEKFIMSLDSWSLDEYKQQWREGLERIKTHDTSCLIVDVTTLQTNPRINLWVLYKKGETVFIQSHMLGGELLKERSIGLPSFDSKTCYLYILPRETINEVGHKVDEWHIQVKDTEINIS